MIDLVGKTFGRLTVLSCEGKRNRGLYWYCKCSCGKISVVRGGNLKNSHTSSCGCLQREVNKSHGRARTPLYTTWSNMKRRCTNPKHPKYKDYGGRGIKVCKRWLKFENFLADMGECPTGLTLDRRDNDGDYCKSNCRWVTLKEQAQNRRNSHFLTYEGKTKTVSEWAQELGVN